MEDSRVRPSSTSYKDNQIMSPPGMKRKENVGGAFSISNSPVKRASTQSKIRKFHEENITSEAADRKSEDSGKKTFRKHLHVRTYKKLLIKHAKTGGNQGDTDECIKEKNSLQGVVMDFRENTPQEVNKGGCTKDGILDERELCAQTIEPQKKKESKSTNQLAAALTGSTPDAINQEHHTKLSGSKYERVASNLESHNLLESFVEEMYNHDSCKINMESPHSMLEGLQVKKDPFCKLSKLPDVCHVELDKDYLSSVNSLREFWYKSLNAVLIDGQDCITKSILFVLSLQSHACRPFLIVTTSGSLQLWQAEFLRLAPSMNVIMYQGDQNARKIIRNVEFYEKSGRLMFQVLLADPKAIVEDLDDIACIGWESVIVDKCQNSKMTIYLEQLNAISTDFKLLLFNDQLKDSLSEYRILLFFLNNGGSVGDSLADVKDKFSYHIAYECESLSSKFLEYWVAVPLSTVQLEQYCATLLSNANVLRSNSRSDVVGALHNILIMARKCCDHPYLVDGELRGLLTKGLQGGQVLDAEVCASGKLYLLGKILQEMKDCGLRVVILYQSLGEHGNVSLGDILDDFLRQRFGEDSYEHLENAMIMSKKVAALKKFNCKEAAIFAFLIEKRACQSSVKLRSVDIMVLFDSDWNPLNDLKSLQKLSIEPQNRSIKIFRLYTSYTVEEKILILAKQDIILENSFHSISRNIIHSVLGWGATYLFQKLDLMHSNPSSTCIPEASFSKICLNDVISEVLAQLPGKVEINRTVPCSILIKAQLIGGTYSNNIVLVGEKEGILLSDKDLPSFWSSLLEGRHPKWMHISEHSQRIRKRIQNVNGLVIQSVESNEIKNKRQKINNFVDSTTLPECSQEILANKIVDSITFPEFSQENRDVNKGFHGSCMIDSDGREHKFEDQRNLLMLLRPELSELCDILELPESVKDTAEEFLVYIMNNHEVCSNQITVLQALKISLCWRAASMSRHELDHAESLAIAKKYLKFECTEMEAISIYSKLKILKEKYSCQSGALESLRVQNIYNSQSSLSKIADNGKKSLQLKANETAAYDNSALGVTRRFPVGTNQGHCLIDEAPGMFQLDIGSFKDNFSKNQIDLVEQVFLRRSEDLVQIQQTEVSNFEKQVYVDRIELEKAHAIDFELICVIHVDLKVRNDKVDILTNEFSTKLGKFSQHLKQQKKKLMSLQLDMRKKEQELKYSWLKKAKTSKIDESFDDLPRLDTIFRLESFMEATGNNYSGATNTSIPFPSDEKNTESEECIQVSSIILNGSEKNIEGGDELPFTSAIVDNFELIEQNRTYVEPSRLSKVADFLLGSALQSEELIPNPDLNQGALFSSVQGFSNSVPSSTSAIQELSTDEHRRNVGAAATGDSQDMSSSYEHNLPGSHSVATHSPHIVLTCNEVPPSNSINCQLPLFEHEQESFPLMGYQEAAPQLCSSVEQAEVPAQQESRAIVLESETTIFACSHPSSEQAEVPVEDAVVAAVVETEPSIQHIPETTSHPIRSREDPPLERTYSGHLGGTAIQQDQLNQLLQSSLSIEWIPLQAIYADPMQNELFRIQKQEYSCIKKHESAKLQLQLECEQEIEKVKRKYDALLQGAERGYLSDKMVFQRIYQMVLWHKVFAEEVRTDFYEEGLSTTYGAQRPNSSQHLQESRPQPPLPTWPSSTMPPPEPPSTSNANLAFIPVASPRALALPTGSSTQTHPVITPGPILQVGRSPAPHLLRCRPNASLPAMSNAQFIPTTSQHSLNTSPSTSIRMPGSFAPACGVSQPFISQTSPLHFSAPDLGFSQLGETEDLLESLLADFPATGDDYPLQSIDSRHNTSTFAIILSDEE